MKKTQTQKSTFKSRFWNFIGKTPLRDTKAYKNANENVVPVKKINSKQDEKEYEKQFSVIIPVYNVEQYIAEAIDSVIRQTVDFRKNVQLILIDDGSTDGGGFVCRKYALKYPENIVYRKTVNRGVSAARNLAIELAVGKYISCLDGDDYYADDFLEKCKKFMDKNWAKVDICFTDIEFFEARQGKHPLRKGIEKNLVIRLDEGTVTGTGVAFFKSEVLKRYRYDETMAISEDFKLVSTIMLEKQAYGHVADATYFNRKRYDQGSAMDCITNEGDIGMYKANIDCKRYLVTQDLKKFGYVTEFTKSALVSSFRLMNYKSSDEVLNTALYAESYDALLFCLKHVDDLAILKNKHASYWSKFFMLMTKHGGVRLADDESSNVFYIGNNSFLHEIILRVTICEEKNGWIQFSGFSESLFPDITEVVIRYNGKEYIANSSDCNYENKQQYFYGKKALSIKIFNIFIPFEDNGVLELYARLKSKRKIKTTIFFDAFSKFGKKLNMNQFFIGTKALVKRLGDGIFSVRKLEFSEIQYMLDIAQKRHLQAHKDIVSEYLNRYHELINRRIWIFFDTLSKSDDNGYYLYQYAKQFNDGIEKYFLVSNRANNWDALSQDPNVLDYDCIQDRVMLFFCEKFISSQTIRDVLGCLPKDANVSEHYEIFRTLFSADEIFLRHGISRNSINHIYSFGNKNFKMIASTVKSEFEFVNKEFGYSPGIVKLTGMPRYDFLKNNPEKIIVFAPTWDRRVLIRQEYSESFKKSSKFKFIQSFINNDFLCEKLRENGYTIYCKLHPRYLTQINDFVSKYDDIVKFIGDEITYNKIFEIGSIFVTDYSSAVFDFAFLKKPVLYYQELDDHLDNKGSYFSYERNGFGDVCYDFDTLIEKTIELVNAGCKMPDKYKKRVAEFFTFHDKNNCKRVYDEILKLPARPFGQSTLLTGNEQIVQLQSKPQPQLQLKPQPKPTTKKPQPKPTAKKTKPSKSKKETTK